MLFNSEQKAHGFRIASKRAIFAPMSAANLVPLARRTVSIFLAGLLLASPVFGATRSANEERRSKLPQFEALPLIRSRQNHLLVRAYINGRPAWLGVDSGAPVSAIALHRREHFRLTPISAKSTLPVRIQINGAFNNVAIARELRLGALSLVDEPVVTVDLGGSTRAAQLLHEQEIVRRGGGHRRQGSGRDRSGRINSRRINARFAAGRRPPRRRDPEPASRHYRFRDAHTLFKTVMCDRRKNSHEARSFLSPAGA